jgi:polysaccharide deacetylase 2 family uncharacterized protein YibQ
LSRGFLAGAAWGCVIAGLGLGVASQVASPPGANSPSAPIAETSPAVLVPETVAVTADVPADVPDASDVAEPLTDQVEALPNGIAEKPAEKPAETPAAPVANVTATEPAPDLPIDRPAETAIELPATPPVVVAQAPAEIAPPTLSTESAAVPAQDDPSASTASPSPSTPTGQNEGPVAQDGVAPPEVNAAIDAPPPVTPDLAPAKIAASSDPVATSEAPVLQPPTASPDALPLGAQAPPPPPVEQALDVPPSPPVTPQAEANPSENTAIIAPEAPAIDPAPTAPETDVAALPLVRPAPGFGGVVTGVRNGRLPSIGNDAPADSTTTEAAAESDADTSSLPPVERFARAFENPASKPVFAILLVDTDGPDLDRDALANLPFPVSFVLDPSAPYAASAAALYRKAGQEVVMLATGLPIGATAVDIAVTFEEHARNLPEAVAVVDIESAGFQGNRTLAAQVLGVIADQGRGVLSWDRGLNAASQIARREGLHNATIYRRLDAEGESTPTIRRLLDRAAFKSAQDGRVVVFGETRPETIAALLEWAVEGRAATVALAPITAAMTVQ